jgi:protein phosphatase
MAMLLFTPESMFACNLGDSRIYRHFQGKLQQISTDHVISGKMLGKAPLTQYLGFQEENMALEPSIVEIGYQTGSSYLICSDGVTDMLSDEEIQEILSKTGTAEEKVEELLEMALSRGGRDNVTMILAQINGYEEKNPLKRWAERHSTGR